MHLNVSSLWIFFSMCLIDIFKNGAYFQVFRKYLEERQFNSSLIYIYLLIISCNLWVAIQKVSLPTLRFEKKYKLNVTNVPCFESDLIGCLCVWFEGFSLSKWKRDEKVPTGVFPTWAKHLLLEHLDISQYMNLIPCKRGSGMFSDQNVKTATNFTSRSKF